MKWKSVKMKDLENEELIKGDEVDYVKLIKQMRINELIENNRIRKCVVKIGYRKQRNT